jgi:ribonuclease HI
MATKKKFYVVWSGLRPGIYDNWNDCKNQVLAVEGAKYKSYPTLQEAEMAFRSGYQAPRASSGQKKNATGKPNIMLPSLSVDAACSGNPGLMEYRGINNQDGKEIFKKGPFKDGTNNIGEFLAIVHALALLKKHNHQSVPIYSDSKTAIGWIKKKKANTKLEETSNNEEIFILIDRAETWLQENSFQNPILKWETEKWGENPADFGRK